MLETIITIAIIAGALLWFVLWLRGAASGKRGCPCGSCAKSCPSRESADEIVNQSKAEAS